MSITTRTIDTIRTQLYLAGYPVSTIHEHPDRIVIADKQLSVYLEPSEGGITATVIIEDAPLADLEDLAKTITDIALIAEEAR